MICCVGCAYYILRFKSKFDQIGRALIQDYKDTHLLWALLHLATKRMRMRTLAPRKNCLHL